MKICWDNLERVRLSREGNLRIDLVVYVEMGSCKRCGEPYLTIRCRQSKFCSHSCATGGKNNGMYGKTHTIEARKKLSLANVGKTYSAEVIKRMSKNFSGFLNPNYKGGVVKVGLTTYDTHKDTLGIYEEIRKQEGTEVLEVKCAYCGQWYAPTYRSVFNRIGAINNLNKGESRLYCSEDCKQACPTYKKVKHPRGFKHTSSREVSTYLRQMVMERDNWECQICGKTVKEIQLHVHHMDPVAQNPMFQNDADSCITLCKDCHKKVHKQHGCRYVDLRCK